MTILILSLFDIGSANRRGAELSSSVVPHWRDLFVVAVGGILYFGFYYGRAWLFGMPVASGGGS
jgi:hypothetical protein